MSAPHNRLLLPPAARAAGVMAYLQAVIAVVAVAAIGAPLLGHLDLANIAMLFPLAVLFAAVRLGRRPAVLAAFLSVALFDFFFVLPYFTLAVSDLQYLLTFAVLLAVALITAHLAYHLRSQRDAAERRETRSRVLCQLAPEAARFLETFATLIAISLERVHYIEVAARTELEMASERLRDSLLGGLSHDLRTPLTALVGMPETLTVMPPPLPPGLRRKLEANPGFPVYILAESGVGYRLVL